MTKPIDSTPENATETQFQAIAALAFNFYQQGKLEEAESLFRFLQLVNPKSYYGHAGAGVVAMAQQPPKLEEACEGLSRAAELEPNDASVQASLGEVLLRQGKFEEAAPHFKKAVELDPQQKDPGALRARAVISGLACMAKEIKNIKASSAAA